MGAIDAIIARGFGPDIRGIGTAYSDSRNTQNAADANLRSAQINQQGAQINQQNAVQDQQYQAQDRQAAQDQAAKLNAIYGRAQELAALPQDDPQVQAQWREIALGVEQLKSGGGKSLVDMFKPPKQFETLTGASLGGGVPADAIFQRDPTTGKLVKIYSPPGSTTVNVGTPKPPAGYLWNDPSNPSAGVAPIAGGPQDPAARPMSDEEVAANRKAEAAKADSSRVYGTYQTAMRAVSDALSHTTTGPIAGRMPAFSAEQQIAEGAVAAIAPILKQLFRAAGEGVFTDRDQQLLLDMVPTRTDRQQAKDAKITNINAIVASKLGIEQAPLPTKPPAEMSDAELMDALNGNP